MGLFSSSRKYFAYAASSSLFEEIPDTLESSILQSGIEGGTKADAIKWTINTDQFARAKAQMRYAEKPDGYIRGFPTSTMTIINVSETTILAALQRAVGPVDSVSWTKTGKIDEPYSINKKIQEVWTDLNYFNWPAGLPAGAWDENDATIPIPVIDPSTGVYYQVTNDPSYIRVLSNLPDPANEDLRDVLGADDYATTTTSPVSDGIYTVRFDYVDDLGNPTFYRLETDLDLEALQSGNYVQVKYVVGGATGYWTYEITSGLDSTFEAAMEIESRNGEYLPVAVLMQDRRWFNEDPNSELAITTNRLLKKLATSGDEIRDGFETAEAEDEDGNVGDKWDIFIHYGIPIATNIRGSLQYLYHFFQELEDWSEYTHADYYNYLASSGTTQPIQELNITEAGINGYNVSYRWSYIHTSSHAGQYTLPSGDPLKQKEAFGHMYEREATVSTDYTDIITEIFGGPKPVGDFGSNPEDSGYHDFFVITQQNPEDPDFPGVPTGYTHTIVMGLSMEYKINTSEDGDLRFRYAQPSMFGTDEETREFRIPILWSALKDVPTLHREEAVADGLTATVFLVEVVKVSWYQTSFWSWVFIIIAVILIALAIFNPGFLKLSAQSLALAVGASSATAVYIIYAILQFAVGFVITFAAAGIGGTAGQIFALIAAVAFFYSAGGFKTINSTWTKAVESPGWGTAAAFIQATGPLYEMGFTVFEAYKIHELEQDIDDWIKTAKEQQQQLEDAWDTFGPMPSWLDPMDLVRMYERMGAAELADGYYARTLSANPGIMGIDLITNFSEVALMLPKEIGHGTLVDGMMSDFAQQRGA